MKNSAVSVIFCIAIVLLAAINALAQKFGLFWTFEWFDTPMHFLGGFVVALGYWSARERWPRLPSGFLATMLAVLIVGVGWEAHEYAFNAIGDVADTAKDLVMDLSGGIIGYFAARRIASLG